MEESYQKKVSEKNQEINTLVKKSSSKKFPKFCENEVKSETFFYKKDFFF